MIAPHGHPPPRSQSTRPLVASVSEAALSSVRARGERDPVERLRVHRAPINVDGAGMARAGGAVRHGVDPYGSSRYSDTARSLTEAVACVAAERKSGLVQRDMRPGREIDPIVPGCRCGRRAAPSPSSRSLFHTFGEVAQRLAVCAVRNLMSHHHEDRQWPFDDLDDCQHRDADIPAKARMRKLGHRSRMPRGPAAPLRCHHASVSPARWPERARRVHFLSPCCAPLERPGFGAHRPVTSNGASTCSGSTTNPASRQPSSPPLRRWTFL